MKEKIKYTPSGKKKRAPKPLTERQKGIAIMYQKGMGIREIGRALNIDPATVIYHLRGKKGEDRSYRGVGQLSTGTLD